MFGELILECDWNKILPYVNSSAGISNAIAQNKNINSNLFPLTSQYLNSHYANTDFVNLKKSFKPYNCAAAMYSYFLMTYGAGQSGAGQSGAGQVSGAIPSTGFNPYGVIDWNILPMWLWLALLIGIGLFVYEKIK